jgi:multimeric flavodoxin WrbA
MKRAEVILFGSPVYFGGPTAQLKAFFDKSRYFRKEKAYLGKHAAVLTVGGSKYGGQETTVKAIQDCLLVQGMVIMGDGSSEFDAGHQGVCAHRPAAEDEFAIKRCKSLAKRILEL